MSEIADRLINQHKDLAEKADLVLSAKECLPDFGGSVCLKYTNGTFSMMITKSRDGVCYYVGNGDLQEDNWYSVDIVWNYLQRNREYRRMKLVNSFLFIKENIDELMRLFGRDERSKSEEWFHHLKISRSKMLFRR